jgi:hypothetical protein
MVSGDIAVSNLLSADAAMSLAISALSTQVSSLSAAHTSLVNRVSANSAVGGGGSVTSTELSAVSLAAQSALSTETSARIAADSALSTAISAVSQQLSLQISAMSQALSVAAAALSVRTDVTSDKVSVLSQVLSVFKAGIAPGGAAMGYASTTNTITGSAVTNISGLSVPLAAGGVYEVQARLLMQMSDITAIGFGLSYPQLAAAGFKWRARFSAAPGSALSTTGMLETYVMESAAAANTNAVHISIPTATYTSGGPAYIVFLDGILEASASGTLQVVAKQLSDSIVIRKGSFLRVYRIV